VEHRNDAEFDRSIPAARASFTVGSRVGEMPALMVRVFGYKLSEIKEALDSAAEGG
jgi:hypothetical protein